MEIAVIGTGYVGLVTGVSLSEIGHKVTCIDIDTEKVKKMKQGISPIYEPGLSEMMKKNIEANRLRFTSVHKEAFEEADIIYIAVGTPEKLDGSADFTYIEAAAKEIANSVDRNVIVVTKSTVPVGSNQKIKRIIENHSTEGIQVEIVSNPEFLKEGSAIYDAFNGDRIVIGSSSTKAAALLAEINKPFGIPIFQTDIKSAEMIKYASNAFLATKISFINEISNLCELLGANIEEVAKGMGLDQRIGNKFLNAGIGYGGSCFPKDTKALVQIAGDYNYDFELLKGVINVNKKQQILLINKLLNRFGKIDNLTIGILGLAFKPNTDDVREAASIIVIEKLVSLGANVVAYDPVAIKNAKSLLPKRVRYTDNVDELLEEVDTVLILTEWEQIKNIDLNKYNKMNTNVIFDGRNCYEAEIMEKIGFEYYSIGRPLTTKGIKQITN
ncbi:UDP-glucose/GDP-mannose dehydrogenase family protein [Priestia aryabhattai]|uniref:UDP-glucose dehydrogenase family protein n=1 Tax=Priestia aryabhattai TaxID=412384 RepID=UPI002E1B972F|nr:UDP-glucose/GDP-mannose dehydrogenase family protein [Priestia aryabhattai]